MSIWNKVLIGLILLVSIGLFILTARALKTHQYWRQQANRIEGNLAKQLADEETLSEERRQLSLEVHEQALGRGRVWYGCRPQPKVLPTGEVSVETPMPDHRITANTVLWVFDEFDVRKGGRYLGQFTVVGIAGPGNQQLQLRPTMRMSQEDFDKLQKAAARNGAFWALCELMPTDSHEVFAGLDKQQLESLLPKNTAEQYVMDGQVTSAEEVKTRALQGKVFQVDESGNLVKQKLDLRDEDGIKVEVEAEVENEIDAGKGKYVRQLRNYEELFRQHYLRWSQLNEEIETTRRYASYIDAIRTDSLQELDFRQKERNQLDGDRKKQEGLRDAALARLQTVAQTLDAIRKAIVDTIQANQAMAGEIAQIQQEAARLIDERTQRMARSGVGD